MAKEEINYPWRLDPKLSIKQIEKCYQEEISEIDRMAQWRKSPYKVPWYPWAYYCVALTDYTKYQWKTNNQL